MLLYCSVKTTTRSTDPRDHPHRGWGRDHDPLTLPTRITGLEVKVGRDALAEVNVRAAERWVAALNADGRYGEWRSAICRDMNLVPQVIDEATFLRPG